VKRSLWIAFFVSLVVLVFIGARTGRADDSHAYRLIVNEHNEVSSLRRLFVERAFLKKVKEWPGGSFIAPVDLKPASLVRKSFSEQVLKRSTQAVRNYWQRILFSGRDTPPAELPADVDVVRHVRSHPGAIGYVSVSAELDLRGTRVVTIEGLDR
jgi:ABC-type phosphate transport system substrate-binding protein